MQNEDQLNAEERELERALLALRPAAARVNGAAAAIAARNRVSRRRTYARQAAAAAVVVTAIGGWLIVRWRGPEVHVGTSNWDVLVPRVVTVKEERLEAPALLAYRQALMQSPAALDALLDRQAAAIGGASSGRVTPAVMVYPFSSDPFGRSM